jgi:hypothetical protein
LYVVFVLKNILWHMPSFNFVGILSENRNQSRALKAVKSQARLIVLERGSINHNIPLSNVTAPTPACHLGHMPKSHLRTDYA